MNPIEAEKHVKTFYSDAEPFLFVKSGYIIIHGVHPAEKFLCHKPQQTIGSAWILAAEEINLSFLQRLES
jgi:hypothetical protein